MTWSRLYSSPLVWSVVRKTRIGINVNKTRRDPFENQLFVHPLRPFTTTKIMMDSPRYSASYVTEKLQKDLQAVHLVSWLAVKKLFYSWIVMVVTRILTLDSSQSLSFCRMSSMYQMDVERSLSVSLSLLSLMASQSSRDIGWLMKVWLKNWRQFMPFPWEPWLPPSGRRLSNSNNSFRCWKNYLCPFCRDHHFGLQKVKGKCQILIRKGQE